MTNSPGYLLPTVISPVATRCITLEIPDDPGHIRAFLGQLDMLSFWWTWKRDALKQGTQAARRWQSVVDSAREQLDFFGECPVGFDIRIQDCILQKSLDGGETWIDVADLGDCAGEGPMGPQGPIGLPGADGADGADGQPVELRTYFGTVQWRVVGTEVWNHLLNLSEITGPAGADGADGQPVELRTYFGTVQWRVTGTTVWNHLMNLDDICDCEEETPPNPNFITDGLLCSIGYRLAAEIRKYWDEAYELEPTLISDLANGVQNIAGFVGTFYLPWAVPAQKVSGAAGFIKWLDQAFQATEANSFTTGTEYYIAEQIFCELSRRQQREITTDVLIDIAPHIYNAPDLTERQKLAVVGLILSAPEEAWQWAAYAAAPFPDATACAGADCEVEDGLWCASLMGDDPTTSNTFPLATNPVVEAMLMQQLGRLSDIAPIGYEATGGYGYPFLPDIVDPYPHRALRLRIDFPRPTQISRLEFLSNYNQTAATATGTRLKVTTGDGTVLINETVTGVTSGTAVEDIWWGDITVETIIIEGELWSDMAWGGFGTIKLLDVYIQGDSYNPFGTALANCTWLAPPPADEIPPHDWTATFNFMESDWGFTASSGNGGVEGAYIPGLGWRTTFTDFYQFEGIVMDVGRAFAIYSGVVAFAMSYSRQNFNGDAPNIRISNPQSQVNFPNDSHGIRTDLVTYSPMNVGSGVRIRIICASVGDDSLNGTEGEAIVYQLRLYGTGTRPAGFAGVPD